MKGRRADRSGGRKAEAGEREMRALWTLLAVLVAVRALLALSPTMWLWSMNTLRFVEPLLGWISWAVAALALLPPIVRRLRDPVERFGDRLARGNRLTVLATAGAVAFGVFLMPDRIRFLGDSYLRGEIASGQGSLELVSGGGPGQFLPLDALLHFHLPRTIAAASPVSVELGSRVLGAVEVFVLVLIAVAWVRVLGLTGGAAIGAVFTAGLGGTLALFTGYGKSTAEMTLLAAGITVSSLVAVREGRGAWIVALLLATALLLHRSAILLVPPAAWVFACAFRTGGPGRAWPALVPVAIAIGVLPRILETFSTFDRPLHLGTGAAGATAPTDAGGLDAWLIQGTDLVNVVLLGTPLVLALPLALVLTRRRAPATRERIWGALVVLPVLALFALFRPQQGMFRDWDVFAMGSVIVSLGTACAVGSLLQGRRAWAGLGAAAALATAVPTLHLLAVTGDVDRSLARIEASVSEPPPRPGSERARTWVFLGVRNEDLERWDATARAFSRSAGYGPNLRVIAAWAHAEEKREDWPRAQAAYQALVEKAPDGPAAWDGLHRASVKVQDLEESWRSARELARLHPGDDSYRRRFAFLDSVRRTVSPAARPGAAVSSGSAP